MRRGLASLVAPIVDLLVTTPLPMEPVLLFERVRPGAPGTFEAVDIAGLLAIAAYFVSSAFAAFR